MTAPAPQRTVLPLPPVAHECGRSAMTCHYRCDDACSKPVPNASDNEYFGDIVARGASRRSVLKGGSLAAAVVGLTTLAGRPAAAAPSASPSAAASTPAPAAGAARSASPFGFVPIGPQPAGLDQVVVPEGFDWEPVISWGDPLTDDAPDFDFDDQSAAAQEKQFGYNCDYTDLIRTHGDNDGVLVCNNEYTNDELMFRGYAGRASLTPEQLRITMAAHGMSVVEVRRKDSSSAWKYVKGARLNRRITATTPFRLTGLAAGSALV